MSPRPSGKGGNFPRAAALMKAHGITVEEFVGALSADLIEQQGAGTDEELFEQRLLQYLWDPVLESLRYVNEFEGAK
ncbi:hypothetical protein HYH03_018412 [Edaphochlamys debaryana]|nr:hypothetical protein HYH03_018412 [Edaphochlamys debaryana]|eukprot:KAG2482676.1 hypothetical protein HYH03_018412 [Edaphochlamys debaryana]